jgi:hypothetical protein
MTKFVTFAAVLVLSVAVSPHLAGQSVPQEKVSPNVAEQTTDPQCYSPAGYRVNPHRPTHSAAPTTVFSRLFSPKPYCPQAAPRLVDPGQANGQDNLRIVYVPYSCPPPIYIERMQRNRLLKQRTEAAYLQEYPEMPQNFYTTRGPRDFLIPTEKFPSIGY